MLRYNLWSFASLLLLGILLANPAFAGGNKAGVRFVAQSMSFRTTWAYSEDVYLVEIHPSKNGQPYYGKLLDAYQGLGRPLPLQMVTSKSPITMKIARDSSCDVRYGNMLIRSAPGDPVALLPGKFTYESSETKSIPKDTMIPCYRTVGKRAF